MDETGYGDPAYAVAMAMDGTPIQLPGSGGWLIERAIASGELRDAMAPYPFLVCRDWRALHDDISALGERLVSIMAITDPLADTTEDQLKQCFNHVVRPYKPHFVIDLGQSPESFVDPHHRGCAKRALKRLVVERCNNPESWRAEWIGLYECLVRRHEIRGPGRLTTVATAKLFGVSGLDLFRARRDGRTVGMIITLTHDRNVYFHLGAYNEEGYRTLASYALVWSVIQHFAGSGLEMLNIGAGAGAFNSGSDGLTAFKRGWSSSTRMTYFCGHIGQRKAYDLLSAACPESADSFFPPYRVGEFS